jgi:hypothetical protein
VGIATRWSNVLRTGSVEAKFVAVDFGTLMFTMERGRDILEVGASFLWIGHSLALYNDSKIGAEYCFFFWVQNNGSLDLTISPDGLVDQIRC